MIKKTNRACSFFLFRKKYLKYKRVFNKKSFEFMILLCSAKFYAESKYFQKSLALLLIFMFFLKN